MSKKIIISVVAVVILALIGGGAVWYFKQSNKPVNPPVTENELGQNASTTTENVDTSNWLTYRNEEYGFEVKYPKEWNIVNSQYGNGIIFYGEDWKKEKDDFKKSLMPSEMSIKFEDNIIDLEKWILKSLNQTNYKTIQEMVKKEIDIFSYSTANINNLSVPVLTMGAEIPYNDYFFMSKSKEKSYIILTLGMSVYIDSATENLILSTIKLY